MNEIRKVRCKMSAVTAYEKVQLARSKDRPGIRSYIDQLFDGFIELHGDRLYRDDPSVLGGLAFFHGIPVTVIGHRKGRNAREQARFNFGMASPEGFRKAHRLMEEAEKFGRPVITLIDTPGAYPGMEAESNGQSNAIAENLALMSRMRVPSIAVITGEGSSGGALALAVSDRVFMMENAVYSILSPEGFASILWKDAGRAEEAAGLMKITAQDLFGLGLIDDICPEEGDFFRELEKKMDRALRELMDLDPDQLVRLRYEKYRSIDRMAFEPEEEGQVTPAQDDRKVYPVREALQISAAKDDRKAIRADENRRGHGAKIERRGQ